MQGNFNSLKRQCAKACVAQQSDCIWCPVTTATHGHFILYVHCLTSGLSTGTPMGQPTPKATYILSHLCFRTLSLLEAILNSAACVRVVQNFSESSDGSGGVQGKKRFCCLFFPFSVSQDHLSVTYCP